MWSIGNIFIKGKVVLAPMAGITSVGYRRFMMPFGVDVAYTEMVSDMGLIYNNKETISYVEYPKERVPVGVQLFGNNPENLAKASLKCLNINPNIDFFDINIGCPVYKVTKTGSGSKLMQNPRLCGDIVKAVKNASKLPVTAKIRLGWNAQSVNFLEVINELEKAGVSAIAIHGRTKEEGYSGLPHYELLKNLRDKMTVPLIISGNINTLDDAINALKITKADGVMVARGGIGNPFLITQIKHYFETGERLPNASLKEQVDYCKELAKEMINDFGEDKAMRIFRGIAVKFFSGFPGSKDIKRRLSTELTTYQSLLLILKDISFNYFE